MKNKFSFFCPKCKRVKSMCNCDSLLEGGKRVDKKLKQNGKRVIKGGGSNNWIFVRNGWYNFYADRLNRCSLWFEAKENNMNNLRIGDNVLIYCRGEFIASGSINSIKKDVKYSSIDCTIDTNIPDNFYWNGSVIGLENVEIFEPDYTVDIRSLLYKLHFIRGKKDDDSLSNYIEKGNWGLSVNTNIRSIDKADYNLIVKTATELKENKINNLQDLRQLLIENDNSMYRENMSEWLFEALGNSEWLLDSEKRIKKNWLTIMKTKLAKVGINYDKDDYIEIEDLEDGEYLCGDGDIDLLFGYEYMDSEEIIKLSDIKEEILNGKIVYNDDGYLIRI